MTAATIVKTLKKMKDPDHAKILQRFFKTGPGEYGEGDIFMGIRVPELRRLSGTYKNLPFPELEKLLASPIHDARMLALLICIRRFKKKDNPEKIYELYLGSTRYINNWDLVDISAPHIVGAYLADKNRKQLYTLAKSESLWERRMAIIATFHFIRQNDFSDTLKIAVLLLPDAHDLIHKAVGWMLREVGKRDLPAEEDFLKQHYHTMPRTMLRYAIERFPEKKRKGYLRGTI